MQKNAIVVKHDYRTKKKSNRVEYKYVYLIIKQLANHQCHKEMRKE